MKKILWILWGLILITLPNYICCAEQETSIPSEAVLFEIDLLQEGKFPENTIIDEDSKQLADNIRQSLCGKSDKIDIAFWGNDRELANLYECVINDTPMLYDVSGTVYISKINDNQYEIYPVYRVKKPDETNLFSTSDSVENAIDDILAQVSDEMTDLEKILAVHDYMCTHYEYDYTYSYYYANEFFKYKRGVCNAYTLAFKYIMDRIGIECYSVTSEKMNHAWNIVCVDGNYYHIDVTWDEGSWDQFGRAKHPYFMLSDEAMSDSEHKHYGWSGSIKATDTKYDSYVWSGFNSPMQYYDGYWYTAQSGKIYQCSVSDNTKTELGYGEKIGIYEDTMYITDSSYKLYTIPMNKISNFKPVPNDSLNNLQSLELLNGVLIEDGYFKYAVADEKFYDYEYKDDRLPHATYDNYYEYRYFYSVDLTEYKDSHRIGDNITWTADNSGTLRIMGTGDMYNSSADDSFFGYYTDEIQSVIIENGITAIGDYIFYKCSKIESVTIPESITTIGNCAFYDCGGLININWNAKNAADFSSGNKIFENAGNNGKGINVIFGDNVEHIPAYAFYSVDTSTGGPINCYAKLASVTLGENITTIGNSAFGYNSLTDIAWNAKNVADFPVSGSPFYMAGQNSDGINVVFGNNVERIPANAFQWTEKLTSVTIGENVTSIGESAFYDCKNLESITIPDSISSIEDSLFYNCTGLKSVTIGKNVTSIGESAFFKCTGLTEINWNAKNVADFSYSNEIFYNAGTEGEGINVVFGDNAEHIPAYVFYANNYTPKITSVTIGKNVAKIGDYAFYNCKNLASVIIGENVSGIGDSAFYNCTGLTEINWNAKNVTDFGARFFINIGNDGEGINVVFGDSVERIPAYVFCRCKKLINVTIGENVSEIGDNAFSGTGLTSVVIPDSVITIGDSAFSGTGLTSVIIPDSVITIGDNAFSGTGLTSVIIPDSVVTIGDRAFYSCDNLTSVTIGENVSSIGDDAFCYCANITEINWNAKNVADFSPDNEIFYEAGTEGEGINVVFGDNVRNIPAYVFYTKYNYNIYTPKITSVTIGKNVAKIGDYAFYNRKNLASVTIGENVSAIGDNAFSDTGLTNVIIPDSVVTIGNRAFYNCKNLVSVIIGENVSAIGNSAFYGCENLASVTIGENVSSIGDNAFYGCDNLTKINWNAKNVADFSVDSCVFTYAGMDGDGIEVVFGDNVRYIPAYAFYRYINLIGITISENVSVIGDYAFSDTGLTSVIIPDSVVTIRDRAFYSCDNLTSVTIGKNVSSIGNEAFCVCYNLTKINWNAKNVADFSVDSCAFAYAGMNGDEIEVVFGDNVEYIPAYAFDVYYSSPITRKVVVGKNVTKIGQDAFRGFYYSLLDVYYNGNRDKWNAISNILLTNVTMHYFVYVTLFDKDENEISTIFQEIGKTLDTSVIEVPEDSLIGLYFDKDWNNAFDIATPITEDIILYALAIKPGKINITGTKNIAIGGNGFSQKITFVTDKEAKYFVCTVKYPTNLTLKQIKSENFEIEQDFETVGEYNYLYLTCIYNGYGNIPVNIVQSAFDIYFDISENVHQNDVLTIEISDDAVLADGNGNSYIFSDIDNAEIRIDSILTRDIVIDGEDNIDSETVYIASVFPSNATNKKVKWSVSDERIATISQSGRLKPIRPGSVTVRATAKDESGVFAEKNILITVPLTVTDITINGSNEVYNAPYYYTASVFPADADDTSVEWSVSDETIAVISQDGKLTPIKTGTVTIRVIAKDGSGVFAEKTVSVIVVKKVTDISIQGADSIDSETTYTAIVSPENADDKSIEWSVSDETIATISQDGILTPIRTGAVTVRATAKDGSGVFAEKTVSINVTAKITNISTNLGIWDMEYSPLNNDYVIYVPMSTTSIKFKASHNGTLKSADNKTFINNVEKTVILSSNQTVLTLNYSCDGFSDNTYTFTIVRFEGTKTTVSGDGKVFTVKPINIETGKIIILALYDRDVFVEMHSSTYEGEEISFITSNAYTNAKVMIWDSLPHLKPICSVETVK